MPRHKKAAGTAVDPRNGRKAELLPQPRTEIPPLPRGFKRQATVDRWNAYWADVISGLVNESEEYIVVRWLTNIERYEMLLDKFDKKPEYAEFNEDGSFKKISTNPALQNAMKLEASIRADEAQLGFGPKNRAALGIAIVQHQQSTAKFQEEQSQRAAEAIDAAPDEDDPRLDDD
jgi:hypothetical protein